MSIQPNINVNSGADISQTGLSKKDENSEVVKEQKQVSIFSQLDDNQNGSMEYSSDFSTKTQVQSKAFSCGNGQASAQMTNAYNNGVASDILANIRGQIESMWSNAVGTLSINYNVEKIDVEYENGKQTENSSVAQNNAQERINDSTFNQLHSVIDDINNQIQTKYQELLQVEIDKAQANNGQTNNDGQNATSIVEIDGKKYTQDANDPDMYVSDGIKYFYDGTNMHRVSMSIDFAGGGGNDNITTVTNNGQSFSSESLVTGTGYAVLNDDGSTTVVNGNGSTVVYNNIGEDVTPPTYTPVNTGTTVNSSNTSVTPRIFNNQFIGVPNKVPSTIMNIDNDDGTSSRAVVSNISDFSSGFNSGASLLSILSGSDNGGTSLTYSSREIKDKNGKTIIRHQDGKYYDAKNNELTRDDAQLLVYQILQQNKYKGAQLFQWA